MAPGGTGQVVPLYVHKTLRMSLQWEFILAVIGPLGFLRKLFSSNQWHLECTHGLTILIIIHQFKEYLKNI